MTHIELMIKCRPSSDGGWQCSVNVPAANGAAQFDVHVAAEDVARYAAGADEPSALVRASFDFLLEREPLGSILPRFTLSEIGRYFPDYRDRIGSYLALVA